VMIAAALLGIIAIVLTLVAFRRAQRHDHAEEVSADSAQVEREVYEHLYGKPSTAVSRGRQVERSPDGQTETRRGRRNRAGADGTDRRAGREPGTGVTRRAVRGPMQQT
jgi:hypothetical protein